MHSEGISSLYIRLDDIREGRSGLLRNHALVLNRNEFENREMQRGHEHFR